MFPFINSACRKALKHHQEINQKAPETTTPTNKNPTIISNEKSDSTTLNKSNNNSLIN